MALEGMIWIIRTGAPWRDLPPTFGHWNTVHHRFRRWTRAGVFDRIFETVGGNLDLRTVMVDGTFAKVHQHGAGAHRNATTPQESAYQQGIGRSRGGLTTKLMAMVDKRGRLVRFTVRPGNVGEAPELPGLLRGVNAGELIADKAYDGDPIRLLLESQGIVATIPPKVNRLIKPWYNPQHYMTRHKVENYFCDLKQFRGVATRYCKLGESYYAMVKLATWLIETRISRRSGREPQYKSAPPSPSYGSQFALRGVA